MSKRLYNSANSVLVRWAKIIGWMLLLLAALLAVPNRIPEVVGTWLLFCTILQLAHYDPSKAKRSNWMFGAVVIYLAFKWPEPTMALLFFLLSVVAVVLSSGKVLRRLLIPMWLTWIFWLCHHHAGSTGPIPAGGAVEESGIVVCVGDSLTAYGYPNELQKLVSMEVKNFGFNGYDTDDGMKLVPEIVALRPSVVVLELAGHDYNTGGSRKSAMKNMRAMIKAFKDAGAQVLLVEIARGFINDPWYGFERQLAREYNLQLVPDTMMRRLVYWGPVFPPGSLVPESMRLSEDSLHPNERGNQMMADTIANYLNSLNP